MEKLSVTAYGKILPKDLLTADQLSAQLKQRNQVDIAPEKLKELADAFFIPHLRVNEGAPLFQYSDARRWIGENLTQQCEGRSLRLEFSVVQVVPEREALKLPLKLRDLVGHLVNANFDYSGVYFLCANGEVVYVGQSRHPGARISTHRLDEDKEFDTAYILPVPSSSLLEVEAAFIRLLQPPLNKNAGTMMANADDKNLISDVLSDQQQPGNAQESTNGESFLDLYRRHTKSCPHRLKGNAHTKCSCPIWVDGKLKGKRFRRSTGLKDWKRATRRANAWEQHEKPG